MGNSLKLIPGLKYGIIKAFTDFDKQLHPVGETWTFVETNFLPYDDGLTLHVIKDNIPVVYRLQWRKEEQADIIENFTSFVAVNSNFLLMALQDHSAENDATKLGFLIEYIRAEGFFYADHTEVHADILQFILTHAISLTETDGIYKDPFIIWYVLEIYDIVFHQVRLNEFPEECAVLYFDLTNRILDTELIKLVEDDLFKHDYTMCLYFIGMADTWFSKRDDEFLVLLEKIKSHKEGGFVHTYCDYWLDSTKHSS